MAADSIDLIFTKAPSLITTVLSAFRGYRFTFNSAKAFPVITARRDGIMPDTKRLANFARICGIEADNKLPLIYPLTFIYPLVQIMLARKEAPLSLLKTLNTQMQIIQHRSIGINETSDIYCKLAAHRLVEKGLEIDISCVVQIAGELVWESMITFYYRGRFGAPEVPFQSNSQSKAYRGGEEEATQTYASIRRGADDEANKGMRMNADWYQPPQLDAIPDAPEIARWLLPAGIGFAFARLSGDGNPLHYWKFYAKRFGFSRDFAQPLLVLAETLSRLEKKHPSEIFKLNIAFKGPVYYGSNVILKSTNNGQGERFDIYSEGNPRPCICGNLLHG